MLTCIGNLLDHLGNDIEVAGQRSFVIEGDKPQILSWKKFGLKISVEKNSLSAWETSEVTVAALIGGEFKFPKNTVLVSAVYAVTVSKAKPLLEPLRLEIQHCVDLTGQPGLSKYLKFAIAPVSTHSLPYQFSLVEGGEFSSDSGYGSINRKEFSLVSIVAQTAPWIEGGGGGGAGGGAGGGTGGGAGGGGDGGDGGGQHGAMQGTGEGPGVHHINQVQHEEQEVEQEDEEQCNEEAHNNGDL